MKIVVDKYIPFINGVLEPYAEVVYASPDEITSETVRDADALLIRTRTRVDKNLLEGSRCTFVGTATIGMDHYDMEWCKKAGITAVNAPGCNAPAVAQYVLSAIGRLWDKPLSDTTIAIVGVGHVGRIVESWSRAVGMNVMRIDPPRQQKERGSKWHTLEDATQIADIFTFHTPLIMNGENSTKHLGDKTFFNSLKRRPMIINAARGPVVDNVAWLEAIRLGLTSVSVVDVWEGEPNINRELMFAADISTPHIAGYSEDGKIRATQIILDALSKHFALPHLKADNREAVRIPERITIDDATESYNPMADTALMRSALGKDMSVDEIIRTFEALRDNYVLRPEIKFA